MLARFVSADSIIPGQADTAGTANPQSLNRYSYVTNNPLIHTDPSGHAQQVPIEDAGGESGGWGCSGLCGGDEVGTWEGEGGAVASAEASEVVPEAAPAPAGEPLYEPMQSPAAQAKGEELWETGSGLDESAKLAEARAARDSLATELKSSKNPPATVTAGYNTETGEVAACSSGGGMCAEDHVVQQLGGDPNKVRFTESTRPRTGNQVPVCERCEATYGRNPFPEGTQFRSDRRPQ